MKHELAMFGGGRNSASRMSTRKKLEQYPLGQSRCNVNEGCSKDEFEGCSCHGEGRSRAGHTAAFHRSISCLAHRLRALVIRLWNLLIHSLLV